MINSILINPISRVQRLFFAITMSLGILLPCLQLQGCAAVAVSSAATGAAMVADRRTTGTIIDDKTIEIKATHALTRDAELWKKSHISVISYNNDVLLVGQTPNESMKQQAEDAVKNVSKIRRIYNELTVGEPAPLATRTKDTWITTQVKTKMLSTRQVNPVRVKVVTEEGVVYLMGITEPTEQSSATESARSVSGVNKVVQIFDSV